MEQKKINRSTHVYLKSPFHPSELHSSLIPPMPPPLPPPPSPLPSPSPSPPPSPPSPPPPPPPRYKGDFKKLFCILGRHGEYLKSRFQGQRANFASRAGNVRYSHFDRLTRPTRLPTSSTRPEGRAELVGRAQQPLSPFIGAHPNPLGSNPPGGSSALRKYSQPSKPNQKLTELVIDMSYEQAIKVLKEQLPALGRLRSVKPRTVSIVVYDTVGTMIIGKSLLLTSERDIQNVVVTIQFMIDERAKEEEKQGRAVDKLLIKTIEVRPGTAESFPGINGELIGTTDNEGSATEWVLWDCQLGGEMVQYWQLIRSKLQMSDNKDRKPILKILTARREGQLGADLACGGHYFNTGNLWFDGAKHVGGDERAMPSIDLATMAKLCRLDTPHLDQMNTGFQPHGSSFEDDDVFTHANMVQAKATGTHQQNYNKQQFSSVTEATKALSEVAGPNRTRDILLDSLKWDAKKYPQADRYKYGGAEDDKDEDTDDSEMGGAATKDNSSDKDNSNVDVTEKGKKRADFIFDSDDDIKFLRPATYGTEESNWRDERGRQHEAAVGFDSDDSGLFFPAVRTRAAVEGVDQMVGSKSVSPKNPMVAPARDSPSNQNLIASQQRASSHIHMPAGPSSKMGPSPVVKSAANINPTKPTGAERGGTPAAAGRNMTPRMGRPTAAHFVPGQGFEGNRAKSVAHDTSISSTFQGPGTNFVPGHRRTEAVSPEKIPNYGASSRNALATGAGNLNPIFSHPLNQYRASSSGQGGRRGMTYQNTTSAPANNMSSLPSQSTPAAMQSRPGSPGIQLAGTSFQTPPSGYGTGTCPNPVHFPNYTGGNRVRTDMRQLEYSDYQSHQTSQGSQGLGPSLQAPFSFDPTNLNSNAKDNGSHDGN